MELITGVSIPEYTGARTRRPILRTVALDIDILAAGLHSEKLLGNKGVGEIGRDFALEVYRITQSGQGLSVEEAAKAQYLQEAITEFYARPLAQVIPETNPRLAEIRKNIHPSLYLRTAEQMLFALAMKEEDLPVVFFLDRLARSMDLNSGRLFSETPYGDRFAACYIKGTVMDMYRQQAA